MEQLKKVFLVPAIASVLALTGCGGGSSGSSSTSGGDGGDTGSTASVGGTVEVPAASVTAFENQGALAALSNFFISPAAAAVLGLEPVEGALVELIRIDNDGNQIGDALATTYTSISGEYEMDLPPGVDLSGDLVVRISGTNDATLSAMVVEQDIDINPISDFVARKFIESDADLGTLEVTEVVELRGRAEEFDLTADPSTDIEAMLAVLEEELGEYVESSVAAIEDGVGTAGPIAGNYRSSAYSFDLIDSDDEAWGTVTAEIFSSNFTFTDEGGGQVGITISEEEGVEIGLGGLTIAQAGVWYDPYMEVVDEAFTGTFSAGGILSVASGVSEELDLEDGAGWRWLPVVYNFQQVPDLGLFALLSQEAAVRYDLIDTNGDNEPDALDPETKLGDELTRSLEFFARTPTNMTASDLSGDFGRVYLETNMSTGYLGLLVESNVVRFNGDGTLDIPAYTGHEIALTGEGPNYSRPEEPEENGLTYVVASNGDIESIGEEMTDGFVNDAYNFIAIQSAEGSEGIDGSVGQTLMVKLPTEAPSVSGKRYRLMELAVGLVGNTNGSSTIEMSNSQFNTFLTMDSETSATISGKFTDILKSPLAGGIQVSNDAEAEAITDLTVETASNGAVTITIPEEGHSLILEGYFNEDASLALLTERNMQDGGIASALGLVVLIEVTE